MTTTNTKKISAQDIISADTFQVVLDPEKLDKLPGTSWDWHFGGVDGEEEVGLSGKTMTIRFENGNSIFWLTETASNKDWGSMETGDDEATAQDIIDYMEIHDDFEVVYFEA